MATESLSNSQLLNQEPQTGHFLRAPAPPALWPRACQAAISASFSAQGASPFSRPLGSSRSPSALEGLLRVLVSPGPGVRASCTPTAPPAARWAPTRRRLYLADQAVQVALGPAHGHHLHTRRVQRLDRASSDACGERGSVRTPPATLPAPPATPGRWPTFARPGDKRPAARKPQLHGGASGRCAPVARLQAGSREGGAGPVWGRGHANSSPLRGNWPKGVGAAWAGQSGPLPALGQGLSQGSLETTQGVRNGFGGSLPACFPCREDYCITKTRGSGKYHGELSASISSCF